MQLGLPDFDMLAADSIETASSMLREYQGRAQFLAGGTDLLVKMKLRKLMPRYLINVKGIRGIDRIRREGDGLRIGALTTVRSMEKSETISREVPMLSRAAGVLGTMPIRTLATLGGNLANASPSAEFGPPLLVLDATVRCMGQDGERVIPLNEFFLAPGKSALRPGEMITEVHVPVPPARARCIYLKHSLRRMDVAMVGAAVYMLLDGDVCRDVRIALGAVAPTPFRAKKAEAAIAGIRLTGDGAESGLIEEVARIACEESSPIDDLRGAASYRRKIVGLMVKQGLAQTISRSRE